MSHTVYLKNLDIAPRKTRIVADVVRGMSVNEAEANLMVQRKRAAGPILKLLRSARAGAVQKDMDLEKLYIKEIRVDQGAMLKRFMPRARGSASAIQKKMSHIIIVLDENPHAKPSRFTIVQAKKTKPHPEEGPARRRKKTVDEEERAEGDSAAPNKKGFFKRTFSRKASFGK
jgi:large subunit ribosomal protein L22